MFSNFSFVCGIIAIVWDCDQLTPAVWREPHLKKREQPHTHKHTQAQKHKKNIRLEGKQQKGVLPGDCSLSLLR